jgi:hypothetical protein
MGTLRHRAAVAGGASLGVGALLAVAVCTVASERVAARFLDLGAACAEGRPYLAAVCHDTAVADAVNQERGPALVVFRDSPGSEAGSSSRRRSVRARRTCRRAAA